MSKEVTSTNMVRIVSFNAGMTGSRRDSKPQLQSLEETIPHLESFIVARLASDEHTAICLQEVKPDHDDFKDTGFEENEFLEQVVQSIKNKYPDQRNKWEYHYCRHSEGKLGLGVITNMTVQKILDPWVIFEETENGKIMVKRRAIQIKLSKDNKMIWIVNCHIGTSQQVPQFNNLLRHLDRLDATVPVAICGDFNVADLDYPDGNIKKNYSLYRRTIARLESRGFMKSILSAGAPFTWHAWECKR